MATEEEIAAAEEMFGISVNLFGKTPQEKEKEKEKERQRQIEEEKAGNIEMTTIKNKTGGTRRRKLHDKDFKGFN